jgi:hypothetical protein
MIAGLLALITAAMFTAIALYISIAEQPARMKLVPPSALMHWKPSYGRGFFVQGGLAAVSGLLGIVAFFYGWYISWLYGAFFMLLNWPYTWYLMMPLNKELDLVEPAAATDETRAKIGRWGWMHFLRGLLGAAAVFFYFLAATDMLQRIPAAPAAVTAAPPT